MAGQHLPALHLSVEAGIMIPDSANSGRKRDALNRCCSGLRFHSCLIFEPEEIESLFNTEVFILCVTKFFQEVFGKNTPKEKREITFRRVSNILSLCVNICTYTYT